MTDIEIAQNRKLIPIQEIASALNIPAEALELYGKYKAKIPLKLIDDDKVAASKLILVTAISPTPAGEGKTTTSIGLAQGMNKVGKPTTVVLREPSLGPVFGMKGGAAGGGHSQVLPMEDINLHFTGDFSAIEKANNLLAALIDNNIQSKSRTLDIDPRTVRWKRVMDMNDRSLRNIVTGLGGLGQGVPAETGFDITAASEIMAILCMCTSLKNLKERLGNIFIGYTSTRRPVFARELNAVGAMTALLKDAIMPNLVQTIEGTPAILHGGPFANIAQGTNTVLATKMGMSLSPYVITEAGFGADLGAEKFLNIKCQSAGLKPSTVVLVATVRALKFHGGIPFNKLHEENIGALGAGFANLKKHTANMSRYEIPVVVAINKFPTDTDAELQALLDLCASAKLEVEICKAWESGGSGAKALAKKVAAAADSGKADFRPLYKWSDLPKQKIERIATEMYGADGVDYSPQAEKDLKQINHLQLDHLAICMAKTQYSLSDNPSLLGHPSGFRITIRQVELAAGAGFIIPITGSIMRMPGLPAVPSAESIDVDAEGRITGLF